MSLTLSSSLSASSATGAAVAAVAGDVHGRFVSACRSVQLVDYPGALKNSASAFARRRIVGGLEFGGRGSRIPAAINGPSPLLEILSPQNWLSGVDFASFRVRGTRERVGAMGSLSSKGRTKGDAMKPSDPSSGAVMAQESSSTEQDFASISDAEWKQRLTKEQFNVARKKGTERAFTGEYWNTKTSGTYSCICCDTPLFDSSTKFDSGTGWPSYGAPIGNNVKSETDWSIPYMPRTEVVCAKCDAHLGHVFSDGPRPTGKRYCINSVSLKLKPATGG